MRDKGLPIVPSPGYLPIQFLTDKSKQDRPTWEVRDATRPYALRRARQFYVQDGPYKSYQAGNVRCLVFHAASNFDSVPLIESTLDNNLKHDRTFFPEGYEARETDGDYNVGLLLLKAA